MHARVERVSRFRFTVQGAKEMLNVSQTDAAAPVGPFGLDRVFSPAVPLHADPHFVGPSWHLLREEILRVGATVAEIKAAESIARGPTGLDPAAYERLNPRMRRLVDLLAVAGGGLSSAICAELEQRAA